MDLGKLLLFLGVVLAILLLTGQPVQPPKQQPESPPVSSVVVEETWKLVCGAEKAQLHLVVENGLFAATITGQVVLPGHTYALTGVRASGLMALRWHDDEHRYFAVLLERDGAQWVGARYTKTPAGFREEQTVPVCILLRA